VLNHYLGLKKFSDPETATLASLEFSSLPFAPKRIYWIQDFTPQAVRGNHSHKELTQIFIMLSGQLTLEVFEGTKSNKYEISRLSPPLIVPPGTWRIMSNASADALLFVLADRPYEEKDYIRDWNEYLNWYSGKG
jgi:hypothetical protein